MPAGLSGPEHDAWLAGWLEGQHELHDDSMAEHAAWVVAMEAMYCEEQYA